MPQTTTLPHAPIVPLYLQNINKKADMMYKIAKMHLEIWFIMTLSLKRTAHRRREVEAILTQRVAS
jgi:hypothetical protein